MDAIFDDQKSEVMYGWHMPLEVNVGAGCSGYSLTEAASLSRSPRFMRKKRRLSQLLDKITVLMQKNIQSPNCLNEEVREEPLDLSVKPQEVPAPEVGASEHTCSTCGQAFWGADHLAKHIASRHRDRPPEATRAYKCTVCNRRFARSDMLARHSRVHSGVKPYSCRTCGQVFSRSDHLATHKRTHTGEKPYCCPFCSYRACRRDMITRHMRTHTPRPPPSEN